MGVDQEGTDPWNIKFMICLEGWLRNWGRVVEADKLKADSQANRK
jgi:hypothetical protein